MITKPSVKINLGLNVLRKRPDGFHDIETLFFPTSQITDTLEIIRADDYSRTSARLMSLYGETPSVSGIGTESEGDVPTLSQAISPDGKLMITVARREGVDWPVLKDLCAKAYAVLDADFHLSPVKIFLEKTSPVGSGLGGGSSDAACALEMLSEMFSLGLDRKALAEYASRLGSDCPFFIWHRPMFGEGRGEILSAYDPGVEIVDPGEKPRDPERKAYELRILTPEGISVSTAEAYGGIVPSEPEMSLKEVLRMPVERWKDLLVNDFEQTVFKAHPELASIKQSLYDSGAAYASMSGSGSALFALYEL